MKNTTLAALGSAALLSLPALLHAAPKTADGVRPVAWPPQFDAGSLGLLGAGLVLLAISRNLRRRS